VVFYYSNPSAWSLFKFVEFIYWNEEHNLHSLGHYCKLISLIWFGRTRLMTSSAMMAVIVLTWLFGVLAVNHTEDKIYHYIFIVFYTFQVSRLHFSWKDVFLDWVEKGRVVELLKKYYVAYKDDLCL